MAGVQAQKRRRIALLLMGLGLFFILLGVGLGAHHCETLAESREGFSGSTVSTTQLSRDQQANVLRQVLFLVVVLVGILGVSLYAFKVWSRRFRQMLLRKPAPPTPNEDVWAMHRLPDDAENQDPDWSDKDDADRTG